MKYNPTQPIESDSIMNPMGQAPDRTVSGESDRSWESFEMIPNPYLKPDITVKNFQQYIVYKSLINQFLVNGSGTGLGKTLMCYLTYFYYKMKYPQTRLIIVTTASAVLQYNSEYYKFFQDKEYHPIVLHESMERYGTKSYAEARLKVLKNFCGAENEIPVTSLLMNYAILLREGSNLIQAVQNLRAQNIPIFLILDEASHFKNLTSKTFKVVQTLSSLCSKVIAATATISNGRLEEVYAILRGINICPFGNKTDFMKRYCVTTTIPGRQFGYIIIGYKNLQEFVGKVSPYIISLKRKDVISQLPSVSRHISYIEHDPEQLQIISDLYQNKITFMPDSDLGELDISNKEIEAVTLTGYIKNALIDPYILSPKHQKRPKGYQSPKTKEIIRLLSEEIVSEKTIIYSTSKRYMYVLADALKHSTIVPKWYSSPLIINGDVSAEDRERIKETFTKSDSQRLVIINEAASEAVNLQAAQAMIITSVPQTFGRLVQIAGRYNRIGSQHSNLSLYFLLTEHSQDLDEYLLCNQQGLLVSAVTKESYDGVLDIDYVNSHRREYEEDITEADLSRASIPTLVYRKKEKRKAYYMKRRAKK